MTQDNWKSLILAVAVCVGVGVVAPVVMAQDAEDDEVSPAEVLAPNIARDSGSYLDSELDSPLLREPTTAAELFEAAVLMDKLARPEWTKRYLEKLMESGADDEAFLSLQDRHGPAIVLKLANSRELHPVSRQLLSKLNELLGERRRDPTRILALIDDLFASATKKAAATATLRNAGTVAVPYLLGQLADPDLSDRHAVLVETLSRMGGQIEPALLGALDSPDETVRLSALVVLGRVGKLQAAPFVSFYAFDKGQPVGIRESARQTLNTLHRAAGRRSPSTDEFGVSDRLRQAALKHLRGDVRLNADPEGQVPVWFWDAQSGTVAVNNLPQREASLFAGARFARQALEFAENDREAQTVALGLTLALDAYRNGPYTRLPGGPGTALDLAMSSGPEVVSDTIRLALDNNNTLTAVAAMQALGQIGTHHQLSKNLSRSAPLISALNYPDVRVQFAAATTILQLDPRTKFPGADRVVAILSRALAGEGSLSALVVDPNAAGANVVGGLFAELGYSAEIANTGRDGFKVAVNHGDVQLIILNVNTVRWGLSQTVANLRADARTAGIPIALYGPDSVRPRVQSLVDRYPMIDFIGEPNSSDHLRLRLKPFLSRLKTQPLSHKEREGMAQAAGDWLAHIAGGKRTDVFDIAPAEPALISAVGREESMANAIFALGGIPSAKVQEVYQQITLNGGVPLEHRDAAARQLAFHIQKFGLLLSRKQVAEIKRFWIAAAEPELATAVASVIGTLKPNSAQVGTRLREFPKPSAQRPVE